MTHGSPPMYLPRLLLAIFFAGLVGTTAATPALAPGMMVFLALLGHAIIVARENGHLAGSRS